LLNAIKRKKDKSSCHVVHVVIVLLDPVVLVNLVVSFLLSIVLNNPIVVFHITLVRPCWPSETGGLMVSC
jgi:hypothetical protein